MKTSESRKRASKTYYRRHRNRIRQRQDLYDQTSTGKIMKMLGSARRRAQKYGISFNLKPSDINIPTHCPILGMPLVFDNNHHNPKNDSPSLDRIIPSIGYIPSNVHVISNKANRMKSNATSVELIKIGLWLRKNGL